MVAWSRSCLRLPETGSFVFLALFKHIASTRSGSMRGTFHQPAFMGSCLTISHTCLPCLLGRHVSPCVLGVIEVRMLRCCKGVVSFPSDLLRAGW